MKLSEVYNSVQGEGPKTGEPTIFVRFAGCNLRCPGWPCDSPYAIFPREYRHEWETRPPHLLVKDIETSMNVCYTGGEPLLQPELEMRELTNMLLDQDNTIECFSNGTRPYPAWFVDTVSVVMDWKLDGSGENPWDKIRFNNLEHLADTWTRGHAIKFTVADHDDFLQARAIWEKNLYGLPLQVYCGPVWGKCKEADVVEWVQKAKLPWKLNVQTHKYVYGDVRGI